MKKTFMRAKQYWLNLMHSTHNKISEGAAHVSRVITSAHGEGWRRKSVKK